MVLARFSPADLATIRLDYPGSCWHRNDQQEIHFSDEYPSHSFLWVCGTALDEEHSALCNNRYSGFIRAGWFPNQNTGRVTSTKSLIFFTQPPSSFVLGICYQSAFYTGGTGTIKYRDQGFPQNGCRLVITK